MYFFTIVTYGRQPFLTSPDARDLLRTAIQRVRRTRPFTIFATVLLPDHWHLVMALPPGDSDYSTRIKRIKQEFTRQWIASGHVERATTTSQSDRGERGVWQPRFWEHTIRDGEDLERCVDYIHWNPRKHQLVKRVQDWPWSSFHRFAGEGQYELSWGGIQPDYGEAGVDWGEP